MRNTFLSIWAITIFNSLFVNLTFAQNKQAVKNYNLGVEASNNGNHKHATTLYSIALGYDMDFLSAFYNRGWSYYHLGYKKAIDDFNQVIRMNENYALAYNNRGLCYDKLNEYDLAIIDYEKSIELNPLDYRPYFNMGLTKVK